MSRLVVIAMAAIMLVAVPGTAFAGTNVEIKEIQFNSPGSDNGSNSSLNHEWVVIRNTSDHAIKLTGWTLRESRDGYVYEFPNFRLKAGHKVTVYTGSGNDTQYKLYWDRDDYAWNNKRDKAALKNRAGDVIDTCSYSGGGKITEC
jgi:hypothetical protein